jgi:uncharacterized tellurite resistance protein B-like protein
LLAQALHLCLALPALQAGGGGGFGGGGGGGGGGDGAGELIFYLVYWLIRFAIEYPPLGVPLLIGVLVLLGVGSRRGWFRVQERTIRRTRRRRREQHSRVSAQSLRGADPAFDEARFLERVRKAFEKAQDSWCAQDLEPLRPFVSDGVFERFSLQIEEQRADGWRQGMEGLVVQGATLVDVAAGTHFDTITVRIPFRADIHKRSLETGKRLPGSQLPRTFFSECWSFVRRRGAKTLVGDGLMEGQCPNCGATLQMNQSAKCGHCECLARSGQFDWVLVEITQAGEWRREREAEIAGLADYAARDEGFSVPLLEDRASVAFWRKCAADRAGRVDPLARVADEAFCKRYADELAPSGGRPRIYTGDCAVGSVRTLGLLAGRERDRAVVEVVWDGRAMTAGQEAKGGVPKRQLRKTLFVFARAAGQTTQLETAFTTACCRTCGAADPGGTDPKCPYCEAPRTGDRSTWLLSAVYAAGTKAGRELLAELAGAPSEPIPAVGESTADLLAWAAALVHADGEVSEREWRALHGLADRAELPRERVDQLLEYGQSESGPRPRDTLEARAWFRALIGVALADGHLGRPERSFLREAGEQLGLSKSEVRHVIGEARLELWRESRRARRART